MDSQEQAGGDWTVRVKIEFEAAEPRVERLDTHEQAVAVVQRDKEDGLRGASGTAQRPEHSKRESAGKWLRKT